MLKGRRGMEMKNIKKILLGVVCVMILIANNVDVAYQQIVINVLFAIMILLGLTMKE